MRILSPRSVCTTTSNFRWCDYPSTIERSSTCEWAGLEIVSDNGPPKTVEASSKLTPCLARFDFALHPSHSKLSGMTQSCPVCASKPSRDYPINSIPLGFGVAPDAVFDVVVQDEVQLLRCKSVVPCQHPVDFVEDGFGFTWIKLILFYPASCLLLYSPANRVLEQIFFMANACGSQLHCVWLRQSVDANWECEHQVSTAAVGI